MTMHRSLPISGLVNPTDGRFAERELIETCYRAELGRVEDGLNLEQSVMVECDKQLVPFVIIALKQRMGRDRFAICENRDDPETQPGSPVGKLVLLLERMVKNHVKGSVVVLPHLDLMALGADNLLDRQARDMSYLLHFNPRSVFLAFKDPEIPLPESLRRPFSMEVSFLGIKREDLVKVITREEARRFGETTIDIYNLYKHVSGLNPLRIRQLLERIKGLCAVYPTGEAQVQKELRERTLAADYVYLPDVTFADVGGHHQTKADLQQDLLRFMDMLADAATLAEIADIEQRLPRHILFEGPPGTGKTLMAKALAHQLDAAVILVNGPELFDKFVGESERKLREVFSKARKSAPAVIILEEVDAIGHRRSSDADRPGVGDTLVNQLLTEMGEFKDEEMVFVIGTTNHAASLDAAFLSRIHKIYHLAYPNASSRREIFSICNTKKELGLSDSQIDFLIEKTEVWINPGDFRRFGGREINALCNAIDRETFGSPREVISNAQLAELVEKQIEVHVPRVSFASIGGYESVKKQLEDDLLSMLELAKQHRHDPARLASIEDSIPRGVIFEGPPGTGKTLFASALANSLGASIIIISASELKTSLYGESERNIRNLFDQARRNSPTVIVFDEMDAIMSGRGGEGPGEGRNTVDASLVNQLLTEMDGLRSRDMVFVIGTTNHAAAIDAAFKRPSRFSRIIHVPYPNEDDRRAILKVYDEKYGLQLNEAQYGLILDKTETWIDSNKYVRFSGDHLRAICQAILRLRIKAGENQPDMAELERIIAEMVQTPFQPISFDDIGGYDKIKDILREEILDMLLLAKKQKENPGERLRIQHSVPKGVIFYGPPGTGKTMFARALASALKASIRVVSGPEIRSTFVGETERQVREIFDQARRYSPAIIVFDEFDSLAGERRQVGGGDRSVVNQILAEMDGLKVNELVFVVATTNHLDFLDEAIKRPGRFEYKIEIPNPDEAERAAIFEIYNRKYQLGLTTDDITYLVFRTEMVMDLETGAQFSGDHLEAICRNLMREQLRQPSLVVDRALLDRLVRGRTNQPEVVTRMEKEVIATHEAGHAIVGKYHPRGVPPRRICIVSELAGALGYVWHGEPENRHVRTSPDLKGQICQLLGGRAAELMLRGEQSVGCSHDLKVATRIATSMVKELGMDEQIGPRCLGEDDASCLSGEKALNADQAIDRLIGECQQETMRILGEHRRELEELRDRLLVEETIDYVSEDRPGEEAIHAHESQSL